MNPEEAQRYLKLWGFGNTKKPETQSKFLKTYIEQFPENSPNLLMLGPPALIHSNLSWVVYNLILSGKLKSKVKLIDIPEVSIKLAHLPFSEKQELVQNLFNENSNSDITVFRSLELSKLEKDSINLVYTLVNRRYYSSLPFISTVHSANKITVAQVEKLLTINLGTALTFLFSDGAKLIEMWDKK